MTTSTLFPSSWRPAAEVLIDAARSGDDSVFFVGPAGTGKTAVVLHHAGLTDPSSDFDGRPTADGDASGDRIIQYVLLGKTIEPSSLFAAILERMNQPLSPRLRRKGATVILQHTANWLCKGNVGALALDEVQHASPEALFHCTLLADVCRQQHGHALGFILLGTPDAMAVVRTTGQVGQRVPIEFPVPLLSPDEVEVFCRTVHEPIARLLRNSGARRVEALLREVVGCAGGSIRRLDGVLKRAIRLAAADGASLADSHVRAAIDIQAS